MTSPTASIAAWSDQLGKLLPRGKAWTGELLQHLLAGIAAEFARLDGRASTLVDEADPSTTLELLPEWERVAGLPDSCVPAGQTTTERQQAVIRKISGLGGQTPAFFIDLAARLGVEIAIEEFRPFRAGMKSGSRCRSAAWSHVWRVRVLASSDASALRFSRFRSGRSRAGDRLRAGGIASLECVITRAAPAHTTVLFAYPFDPDPVLWFDFTAA